MSVGSTTDAQSGGAAVDVADIEAVYARRATTPDGIG